MNIKSFRIFDLGEEMESSAENGVLIADIKKEVDAKDIVKFIKKLKIIESYVFSKVVYETDTTREEKFTEEFMSEFSVDKEKLLPFLKESYRLDCECDLSSSLKGIQECINENSMEGVFELFEDYEVDAMDYLS